MISNCNEPGGRLLRRWWHWGTLCEEKLEHFGLFSGEKDTGRC